MSIDAIERLNAALEGRYAIERVLGQGGMATVYLATDLKHSRQVAVKVLKPELAAVVGADRFLAEIETTANLQHPHILPLFDSGEADSFLFFVMPYIEGETLADRIAREKQLPVDEALGIATAVANALQAAHEKGVIHRDIKPGNILLSRGEPLVADFGIAIAVGAASGSRLTETGLSVGTPYYMSPEQATGDQTVGPASDIFALACVLYEMLVGEPPYPGTTAQAVLGKIIQGLPVSATAVRKSIPTNVDAAIRKALEKLPADRFTGAHSFAKALADPAFRHGSDGPTGVPGAAGTRWRGIAAVMAVVAAGSIGFAAWAALGSGSTPVLRTYIGFSAGEAPATLVSGMFTLSRDGSMMAYTGGDPMQLWVKERDALHPRPLPGSEGAGFPVFSPSGTEIAFIQGGDLKKMPTAGGASITLAEGVNTGLQGAAWLTDGTIVFNEPGYALMRTSGSGGAVDTLASNRGEGAWSDAAQGGFAWPVGLPESRGVIFGGCSLGCRSVGLYVLDSRSGEVSALVQDSGRGWYAPTGHLIYVRNDGAVFAAPFDLESLSITGDAIPLLEGVRIWLGAGADAVMSDTGDLLYLEGDGSGAVGLSLVWISSDGTQTPAAQGWTALFSYPAVSPDGETIAIGVPGGAGEDIYLKRTDDTPPARLTFEGTNRRPFWHPDGTTVGFLSIRDGNTDVWAKRADLTANAELLVDLEGIINEAVWSPDGDWIVGRVGNPGDIFAIRPGVDTVPSFIAASAADERNPAISPDGQWIAYVSDVSGTPHVYVRPFPEGASGAPRQVSDVAATGPRWSSTGRELFYRLDGENTIVATELSFEPSLAVGARRVFQRAAVGDFVNDVYRPQYDVAPDGRLLRIGIVGDPNAIAANSFVYVQNWLEEVRRLTDGR